MTRTKSTVAAFGALVALGAMAVGCAPPIQAGQIVVLPGATERLIVAMQLGYHGAGDVKPPASVRVATSKEELAAGPGAEGKIGDYVLENGSVVAVVAALDGTDRGGKLIDLAREPKRVDELGAVVTTVLGEHVRYTSLKTGTDTATGAAFIEVSGLAGSVPVSTRYDLAPELDAVVVHTSFTRPARQADASSDGPFDVGDVVHLSTTLRNRQELPGAIAVYGQQTGYAVTPLGAPEASVATRAVGRIEDAIGLWQGSAPEGLVVYSRMFVPLERSDTLSLSAALAVARGEDLGEVEINVFPDRRTKGMLLPAGSLHFQRAGEASPLALIVPNSLHAGDAVSAKVPAGAWDVTFVSDSFQSPAPVHVTVVPRQLTPVDVVAAPREAPAPVQTASALPP